MMLRRKPRTKKEKHRFLAESKQEGHDQAFRKAFHATRLAGNVCALVARALAIP